MKLVRSVVALIAAVPAVLLTFCKTNDISSTINNNAEAGITTVHITPAGGEYPGPGGLLVTVPANAVAMTVDAQLGIITSGYQPIPDPQASPVYTLEPHGTTFLKPITVTLPYDATKVPFGDSAGVLHAGTTDPASVAWDAPIAGGTGPSESVDGTLLQTVTVTTSSFSFYVVVASSVVPDDAAVESGGDDAGSTDSSPAMVEGSASCSVPSAMFGTCFAASNLSCSNLGAGACSCTVLNAGSCGGCTYTYACKAGDAGTSVESCTYPGLGAPASTGPVNCASICSNTSTVSSEIAGSQVCVF